MRLRRPLGLFRGHDPLGCSPAGGSCSLVANQDVDAQQGPRWPGSRLTLDLRWRRPSISASWYVRPPAPF
jgi:hypothetical protein